MRQPFYLRELAAAKRIALRAGELIVSYRGKRCVAETKEDGTPVTPADKASATLIDAYLHHMFPKDAILNEETKDDGSRFRCRRTWIVDPLDGTRDVQQYFDQGVMLGQWGVLVGLTDEGTPVMGVAHRPLAKELTFAIRNRGAYLQHPDRTLRQLAAQDPSSPERRLLISGSRNQESASRLEQLLPGWTTATFGSALKIIEVAKGNATAFYCPPGSPMRLWDLCATSIILEEAGGRITDAYGKPFDFMDKDPRQMSGVLASNSYCHDELLQRLRGQ